MYDKSIMISVEIPVTNTGEDYFQTQWEIMQGLTTIFDADSDLGLELLDSEIFDEVLITQNVIHDEHNRRMGEFAVLGTFDQAMPFALIRE